MYASQGGSYHIGVAWLSVPYIHCSHQRRRGECGGAKQFSIQLGLATLATLGAKQCSMLRHAAAQNVPCAPTAKLLAGASPQTLQNIPILHSSTECEQHIIAPPPTFPDAKRGENSIRQRFVQHQNTKLAANNSEQLAPTITQCHTTTDLHKCL